VDNAGLLARGAKALGADVVPAAFFKLAKGVEDVGVVLPDEFADPAILNVGVFSLTCLLSSP
jgi:hypothetical protein